MKDTIDAAGIAGLTVVTPIASTAAAPGVTLTRPLTGYNCRILVAQLIVTNIQSLAAR